MKETNCTNLLLVDNVILIDMFALLAELVDMSRW